MARTGIRARPEIEVEVVVVVNDFHPSASQYVGGPDHHGVAQLAGDLPRLLGRRGSPEPGVRDAEFGQEPAEARAVLGKVYSLGGGAKYLRAGCFELARELQWALAAELQDHTFRVLASDDLEDVLGGQWLEVQPGRGVVVGGDGLRVRVDHHGVYAALLQRVAGVDASVVELNPLADTVGAAPQHHDRGVLPPLDLVLALVGRVVVWRPGRELAGAGVHRLVGRRDAERLPDPTRHVRGGAGGRGERLVGETGPFEFAQLLRAQRPKDGSLRGDYPGYRGNKKRVYMGLLVNLGHVHPGAQGVEDGEDPVRVRLVESRVHVPRINLQRGHRLHEALGERPPYGHDLAHGVHPSRQARRRPRELLEGEARYLGYHVVERRLERGRRRPGYVVGNLIECVPDRQLRRYLRDREPRRLAR